ncbi:MAG: hypothetical protein ACLFTP_06610 [Rhodosalinus sp.]|uniref:hypothetical protein n=1 Tax=Rhodosalinus sp. TaxID=2047741 RepID=UPI003979776A
MQALKAGRGSARPEARVFLDLHETRGLPPASAIELAETLRGDLRPRRLETEAELLAHAHGQGHSDPRLARLQHREPM